MKIIYLNSCQYFSKYTGNRKVGGINLKSVFKEGQYEKEAKLSV